MSAQTIPTSLAPEIIIDRVSGNLQVKGWEESQVVVKANSHDLQLEVQDDMIRLTCAGSCEIRLPTGALVKVNTVKGNAQVRYLDDPLSIGSVHGSLFLRNVAETNIEAVHGELMARQVTGNLHAGQVMGNAMVRDVQGECVLSKVQGNLDLRDIDDEIKATTEGNARIRISEMMGSEYEIHAQGNVHCRIPENASLQLTLTSEAESIVVKGPEGTRSYQQPNCEARLGSGEGKLTISAGGNIFLSAQQSGWEEEEREGGHEGYTPLPADFGEQIARQVEGQLQVQMENMNRQIQEQMAVLNATLSRSGVSPEETERIMRRARESSERANAQALEKMHRAQEKLERKLEDARQKNMRQEKAAERPPRHSFHHSWKFEIPPAPVKEPVADEERLMILHMLEQKKISLEDAERLLSALEWKEE